MAIAVEADRRDTGWADQTAMLKMILRNRHGEESVRENHSNTLEVQGDGDKSLIVFDAPADVKGTAFLSYTDATIPDDQWLFLPALNASSEFHRRTSLGHLWAVSSPMKIFRPRKCPNSNINICKMSKWAAAMPS